MGLSPRNIPSSYFIADVVLRADEMLSGKLLLKSDKVGQSLEINTDFIIDLLFS